MGLFHETIILEPDVLGSRPAAASVPKGAIFYATDTGLLYRNNGTSWDDYSSSSGEAIPGTNGFRLSATTAVPVTSSDVTTTSTIYWTPYKGNKVALYTGSAWTLVTSAELSLALSALTADKNYDVFVDYNGGTPQLVLVAWTSNTARATALTTQDGILVLTGNTDHLYVGTIRTISTTETCDTGGGGTTQVGGKRFIWNYYNRVARQLNVIDTTDTWAYTTDTWRVANGASAPLNCVEFVCGVLEDVVQATLVATIHIKSNSARSAKSGIGLSGTTPSNPVAQVYNNNTDENYHTVAPSIRIFPSLGYSYLSWLEKGSDGTCNFKGDDGVASGGQSGLSAIIFA